MKFYILDVFGNKKYSGNQLAVFLDNGVLSAREMQQIAKEINFSETTFINSKVPGENGYPVRIFTPESEIDFAGHPTLGTAYILNKYLQQSKGNDVKLDLSVGTIPVEIKDDTYWMNQKQPVFGKEIPVLDIAKVLGIDISEINQLFPVLETTTGLPFTIVPLIGLEAVKKVNINLQEYASFIQQTWAKGILVFSPVAYERDQHISARVFVNYLGIPEDPATGSAAGCLAAYLLETGFVGSRKLELNMGQGYEIGRPSLIKMIASKQQNQFEINIGGKVHEVAEGEWNINK